MRRAPSPKVSPIDERVPLPDDMIPTDARGRLEIEAKLAAGYFAGERPPRRLLPARWGEDLYE